MPEVLRRVITPKEAVEFRGIGGCIKRLIHPQTTGSQNLQMAIVYMAPGEEVSYHRHVNEEAYFILSGEGILTMEDHPDVDLKKNVAVYVPPNVSHGQKNTGDEPLVLLTAITPPITQPIEVLAKGWRPEA
ncbi:MAG: cupin domain-containing protein [Chloroflexi bacterium]|nr:cupin domain-containing protein [Chloroflexota bacterium]